MTERIYGTIPREAVATMTGLELMLANVAGTLPGAPIARGLGFRMAEAGEGTVTFEGTPTADHLNPLGAVHGGWALTLIDSACGCAAHTVLAAGVGYTTLETKGNFTRAIRPDAVMRIVGTVLTRGRTIVTAEARVLDAEGRIAAFGTSTLLVLNAPS